MLSEEDVRGLSPADRRSLIGMLARVHAAEQAERAGDGRRRALMLAVIVVCCIVLAIWIGVLAVSLPNYYRTSGWRGAWVGFDVAELIAFAATGWAAWKRRQILVACLIVLSTLLCCDAYFDIMLDTRIKGFVVAVASALVIELPLAALAALAARRLLRLSLQRIQLLEGQFGAVPTLRKTPLIGAGSTEHLLDLFPAPERPQYDRLASGDADDAPPAGGEPPPAWPRRRRRPVP